MSCVFCDIQDYIVENEYAYAIYDINAVSEGHALVCLKRHIADYFDITEEEERAIWQCMCQLKEVLDEIYAPDAYNIGINNGKAAGQTIPHVHVHVIPRYHGDMERPEGGVRGVIPEKRIYL